VPPEIKTVVASAVVHSNFDSLSLAELGEWGTIV